MPIYRMDENSFIPVNETTFAAAGLKERDDIQRRLRENIAIIAPDVMVISDEYSNWTDSDRRIDLLCLDDRANIVIVELKRSDDGGRADLQALRYAAMVSNITFQQVVDGHARYKNLSEAEAEEAILHFLQWESASDGEFGKDVRIILGAADFGRELTTTALWLREYDIDIRCVRLKPYSLPDGTLLLDVQQVIPLAEASDYLTQLADKRDEERKAPRHAMRREFWIGVLKLAKEKNAPHKNRSPSEQSWIGRGDGVNLNYAIRGADVQVEIYIDRGDKSENLRSFAFLEERKAEIESTTGSLLWDTLPDRRACRISKSIEGGWKSPTSEWPAIQARMIDVALAMERAFSRDLLDKAAER